MAGSGGGDGARRRRLAWGCRRGMLELDAILAPLAERVKSVPASELDSVAALLDKEDDELYEILVLGTREPGESLRAAVGHCAAAPHGRGKGKKGD